MDYQRLAETCMWKVNGRNPARITGYIHQGSSCFTSVLPTEFQKISATFTPLQFLPV